jgi:hypothetical protein
VDFEQVLKEVVWRLVTEGRISYRRIKLSFALDDDGLEELRRELIGLKRLAADVDGELLVWEPDGRAARPEPAALLQPLPVNFPEDLGGRSLSRILLLPGNRQVFDAGLL